MFGFGNPKKKLQKKYEELMKKAVDAQRSGNIALYAELSAEADKLLKKIEEMSTD